MEEAPKAKNRLVAGLLGLACAGLGQVFLGRTFRGLAWLAASVGVSLAAYFVRPEMHPLKTLALLLVGALGVQAAALVDAVLLPTTKHRSMSAVAMISFGAIALGLAILVTIGAFAYLIGIYNVSKSMMTPTLLPGDQVLVDRRVYNLRPPKRGEAVAFTFPDDPSVRFIMRIMAGPSDHFAIEGGHPIINGWRVPSCKAGTMALGGDEGELQKGSIFVEFLEGSAYLVFIGEDEAEIVDDEPPAVVGRDRYRVLGDRRGRTKSAITWSRQNGGLVPATSIWGRPRSITRNPRYLGVRNWLDLTELQSPHYSSLEQGIEACLAKRPPPDEMIPPPP